MQGARHQGGEGRRKPGWAAESRFRLPPHRRGPPSTEGPRAAAGPLRTFMQAHARFGGAGATFTVAVDSGHAREKPRDPTLPPAWHRAYGENTRAWDTTPCRDGVSD